MAFYFKTLSKVLITQNIYLYKLIDLKRSLSAVNHLFEFSSVSEDKLAIVDEKGKHSYKKLFSLSHNLKSNYLKINIAFILMYALWPTC